MVDRCIGSRDRPPHGAFLLKGSGFKGHKDSPALGVGVLLLFTAFLLQIMFVYSAPLNPPKLDFSLTRGL
jgi:hypothetical protein